MTRVLTVVGAVVAVLAIVAGSIWAVWWSPIFGVRQVQVEGSGSVDPATVIERAGIVMQTPLIRVDRADVEARVLADPRIATAAVELDWPDTVLIAVTERRAVGVIATGSTWSVVDRDGVAFQDVAERPAGLPEIRATGPGLGAALSVAADLPVPLTTQTTSIAASTSDNVTLTLKPRPGSSEGATVLWGSAEQSARKAEVLEALLPEDARIYNVMAPDRPSVSGVNEASASPSS